MCMYLLSFILSFRPGLNKEKYLCADQLQAGRLQAEMCLKAEFQIQIQFEIKAEPAAQHFMMKNVQDSRLRSVYNWHYCTASQSLYACLTVTHTHTDTCWPFCANIERVSARQVDLSSLALIFNNTNCWLKHCQAFSMANSSINNLFVCLSQMFQNIYKTGTTMIKKQIYTDVNKQVLGELLKKFAECLSTALLSLFFDRFLFCGR